MGPYEITAWIIITIVSFFIMPFFTLAIIFYGAEMPILAIMCTFIGLINMVGKILSK
jgi:hypothetical protein